MASDFYRYFKENMDGLGLDSPEALFGTPGKASSTARKVLGLIKLVGKNVTVKELIAAGTGIEILATLSAMQGSYYAGAIVGSIGVALQRCAMGGTSIADLLLVATKKGIHPPWLHSTLIKYPRIVPKASSGKLRFSGPR